MAEQGWTRRETLSGVVVGAGAAVLPGCAKGDDAPLAVAFNHGVASGDPQQDKVIIWTRVTPPADHSGPVAVNWKVSFDEALAYPARSGQVMADQSSDYTVKVDVDGLAPGKQYFYSFTAEAAQSPLGRTKTLHGDGMKRLTLAVASCAHYPQGYFNAYKVIAEQADLDVVLHLGDYFYEYGADGFGGEMGEQLGRVPDPLTETVTLSDYRRRYAQYRTDPDLQAAHARAPFICIWDDHESANNSWFGGAQNHSADGAEGDWVERKAAAIKAYYEWLPIRDPAPGAAPTALQRSFQFGDIATIVMLEGRLGARSEQLDYARDLPFLETPFDFTNPETPLAVVDPRDLQAIEPENVKYIKTPFDISEAPPRPILDYASIQAMDTENMPEGIVFIPNTEKFLNEILPDQDRTILGPEQEAWVADQLASSKARGTPWQVLGNPVLLARNRLPYLKDVMPPDAYAKAIASAPRLERVEMIARLKLPANLDGWDGYPAARERLYESAQAAEANLFVLSGDTHTAWANNLFQDDGLTRAGIEFGCTTISSVTLGQIFSVPGVDLNQLTVEANDEVAYCNRDHHGFLLVRLTQNRAETDMIIVDTIESKKFTASVSQRFAIDIDESGAMGPLQIL
jgi:alkaline phosphatase D